jgi:hypothetical protein
MCGPLLACVQTPPSICALIPPLAPPSPPGPYLHIWLPWPGFKTVCGCCCPPVQPLTPSKDCSTTWGLAVHHNCIGPNLCNRPAPLVLSVLLSLTLTPPPPTPTPYIHSRPYLHTWPPGPVAEKCVSTAARLSIPLLPSWAPPPPPVARTCTSGAPCPVAEQCVGASACLPTA